MNARFATQLIWRDISPVIKPQFNGQMQSATIPSSLLLVLTRNKHE